MTRKKKKEEKQQVITKNFIITEIQDGGISISTKSYDWKLELTPTTAFGQQMIYFTKNNTPDEVNELLTMVYYTSITMIGNIEFTKYISDFWDKKISDAEVVEDEEQDKKDLEIVKKDLDEKEKS